MNNIYLYLYMVHSGTNELIMKSLENDKLNIFSKQLSYTCVESQKIHATITWEEKTK